VVFNTEALSPLFERVIIASGTSNRQTRALASSVREMVKKRGLDVLRTEGEDNAEWIIVDCGAAVAHIMQPAIRDYYHLEEIWGARPVRLKVVGDGRDAAADKSLPAAAAAVHPVAKPSVAKRATAKRSIAKRPTTERPIAERPTAKRPTAERPSAARSTTKRAAPKGAAPNRPGPKKVAPGRATPHKTTSSKTVPKGPSAKGAAANKPATRKPVAKKAGSNKDSASKPSAKKIARPRAVGRRAR
jgi:ribosome-associated protein